MKVVVALGGNALLQRGQPMTAENQQENIRIAAEALAELAKEHQLVIAHGNHHDHPDESGPQGRRQDAATNLHVHAADLSLHLLQLRLCPSALLDRSEYL